MSSVSHQKKVGSQVFPELLVGKLFFTPSFPNKILIKLLKYFNMLIIGKSEADLLIAL
jgi:hypothetical protein